MQVTGVIKKIGQTEFISDKFQKRQLVLTIQDGKYTQDVEFIFAQSNTSKLDRFGVGETVKVEFNLRGKEYNGKFYNTLDGWKVEQSGSTQGAATSNSSVSTSNDNNNELW